jgi:DNA-binding Xre family transcriptional regulator
MINFTKLLQKLKEAGITTYIIRKNGLIPQSTLTKFNMCNGSDEEILEKLEKYKIEHDGIEFKTDVSTKTIEDICQLLQCQPQDIIDWKVELKPELSYENLYAEKK